MAKCALEHVNITVTDPDRTAERICEMFGWRIRWKGPAKNGGYTVHVGTDDAYIAAYRPPLDAQSQEVNGRLNHVGVVVEDLDVTEGKVRKAGYEPHSHEAYEPGRRFYFDDHDGIEFEVVSYAQGNPAGSHT